MPPLTNRLRAYPIRQVVQPLGSIATRITWPAIQWDMDAISEYFVVT